MIKKSSSSTKFANPGKISRMGEFIDEYTKITQELVNILWSQRLERIQSLVPKEITSQIDSWLTARAIQCSAKQASGIVRGTIKKQKDRLFVINRLKVEGKFKKARKLQQIYNKNEISNPIVKRCCPELDSRFVKINLESNNSFDGWITLTNLGFGKKIVFPFKRTEHFNGMFSSGNLKQGIRLSKNLIDFNFELPDVPKRTSGKTIGVDIGVSNVYYCSDGFCSCSNKDGYNLVEIQKILSRRKKGSVGFRKAQTHRENYINSSINSINLDGIKQINIENIVNMNNGKRTNRFLTHFVSAQILGKLNGYCEKHGVHVVRKNQAYTSQRCSKCGWVHESNRKGKKFKCASCGFACDADLNASINISLDLCKISNEDRLLKKNKAGFFWEEKSYLADCVLTSQESIVPDTQRA